MQSGSIRPIFAALAGPCLVAAATCLPAGALAQAYPAKSIRFIIPYPPGGSADLLGRPLALKLQERLGQSVTLDYKAGAGGTVASQALARSKPDGHTLILVLAAHAINASLYPKLPYDTRKDFAPVSLVANLPMIVAASSALKANTIPELIAAAKASPGKLTFGSAGNGNTGHLAAEFFSSQAGIKMTHVPYKGSAGVVNAMLAGEIDLTFDSISTSWPHIKSGRLRALAVTGEKRAAISPDVPTMIEAGMPGFVINGWYAILAPAGTPAPILDRLAAEFAKAIQRPDVREQFDRMGIDPSNLSRSEFEKMIANENARWKPLFAAAKITVD